MTLECSRSFVLELYYSGTSMYKHPSVSIPLCNFAPNRTSNPTPTTPAKRPKPFNYLPNLPTQPAEHLSNSPSPHTIPPSVPISTARFQFNTSSISEPAARQVSALPLTYSPLYAPGG